MRGDTRTGRVIHSTHTVGGGAGSPVHAAHQGPAAHVCSTPLQAVHTLSLRKAVGSHDGMASTCGALRRSTSRRAVDYRAI